MKSAILSCLAILLCVTVAKSEEQTIDYPSNHPLISLTLPEGWVAKGDEGDLYIKPSKANGAFFVELSTMDAKRGDKAAAIKEAKESIEDSFKGVTYAEKEPEVVDGNGLTCMLFNAHGEDKQGKAHINAFIISAPHSEKMMWAPCISSQEGFETYAKQFEKIFKSFRAKE